MRTKPLHRDVPRHFAAVRFHELESRLLFASPTLAALPNVTLYAGAPLQIPLDGNDADVADDLTFTVTITNNTGSVSGLISPSSNRSLKIVASHVSSGANDVGFTNESMVIKLFEDKAPKTTARIIALANSGFYNNLTFHRVINNFMIQGGDPLGTGAGGSGVVFDDEFDPSLQFTGKGLIAMAKSYDDTDDSQFFITESNPRYLDFNHTIFGQLIEGESTRDKISNVLTDSNDKPINPVIMNSVTVIADKQNGVLSLSVPNGVSSGSATITVTATDPANHSTSQSFTATVAADTTDDPPYLLNIPDVTTRANSQTTFQINAADVDGGQIYYLNWAGLYNNFYNTSNPVRLVSPDDLSPYSTTRDIDVVPDANGLTTVTTRNNVAGVFPLYVGVAHDLSAFDSQQVPLFVSPAAPTSIDLMDVADTGISNTDNLTRLNNANSTSRLEFLISGVLSGAQVQLFDGATLLGTATVPSGATSVVLTTNGSSALSNGVHNLTAIQTLKSVNWTVGNRSGTVDLASLASASQAITIDTTPPTLVSAPIFDFNLGAHSISYTFSESVVASLSAGDLVLMRLDDNSTTPAGSIQLVYSANKATFTFPGYSNGDLPDGNYRATINAGDVTDAAGNPLGANSVLDFWVLAGDVNRDRSVSFADLVTIAQNYGKGGQTYSTGDLNGDGSVGFADLVMVAQNYGKNLPAPPNGAPVASALADLAAASEPVVGLDSSAPVVMAPVAVVPSKPLPEAGPVTSFSQVSLAPAPGSKRKPQPLNRVLFSAVPIPPKPPAKMKQRQHR